MQCFEAVFINNVANDQQYFFNDTFVPKTNPFIDIKGAKCKLI